MSTSDRYPGARQAMDAAITDALAAAEETPDDMTAYTRAVELYDALDAGARRAVRLRSRTARRIKDAGHLTLRQLGNRLGLSKSTVEQVLRNAPGRPEPRPVVAAVIVSDLGALITERTDGTPPWGFVCGEIEPGESAQEAAEREAAEETGLAVAAGRELGRRIHPVTGRTIIYVTANGGSGQDAEIGDPAELTALRWVGLHELDELMPGVYPDARAYIAQQMRQRSRASGG